MFSGGVKGKVAAVPIDRLAESAGGHPAGGPADGLSNQEDSLTRAEQIGRRSRPG